MRGLYISAIVIFSTFTAFGQMTEWLFKESFPINEKKEVIVNSSYGRVFVQPSYDQLGATVVIKFEKTSAPKVVKLIDHIEIRPTETDSNLILTTVFDEALFLKNNLLWELKDSINIEYRVKVPFHMTCRIHVKHGKVLTGRISSPIFVQLDDARLISKLTENLNVSGSNYSMDVSGVKNLDISGTHAQLILSNIDTARMKLSYSNIQSIGFKHLYADFEEVELSSGRTNSILISARESVLEFTDVEESAQFELFDCRLVMQKLPVLLGILAHNGSSDFVLHPQRHSVFNSELLNHNMKIRLRGGTFKLDQKCKKSEVQFPPNTISNKKSAELIQSDKNGLKMTAILKKSELIVKN